MRYNTQKVHEPLHAGEYLVFPLQFRPYSTPNGQLYQSPFQQKFSIAREVARVGNFMERRERRLHSISQILSTFGTHWVSVGAWCEYCTTHSGNVLYIMFPWACLCSVVSDYECHLKAIYFCWKGSSCLSLLSHKLCGNLINFIWIRNVERHTLEKP